MDFHIVLPLLMNLACWRVKLKGESGMKQYGLWLMMGLFGALTAVAERPSNPNIVLILVDDLGWQDVKCYDIDEPSPMETPNLDALASKGIKFWQAYSPAPVCAPSRAAILSGHHPVRGEMTHVAGGHPPYPGHPTHATTISPWYSSRVPTNTYTLAEALQDEGYVTGHSGKWHISKNHYAYPNAYHHGFDTSVHERGVQVPMKPDRITGFATRDLNDPYRLDENGIPFDVPQAGAMTFLKDNRDKPFFLYYATWLVHGPWVMRSEALLRKYEQKLGVTITEKHKEGWDVLGQKNPFYCAMVEQLDYYLGQVFSYLDETEDPRWPGHTLSENTYVIFTSDNGGMEVDHTVTDNYPLDRGKISIKEGGVRVPLIITGPDIPAGVESDVMVNGLDFYPTILSLIGAQKPADKIFDGCDLEPLLKGDYKDPALVRDAEGAVRDTMFWHFPQAENTSSIRRGGYKLLRRYTRSEPTLELFRLYRDGKDRPARVDIEEMKDIAGEQPEMVEALDAELTGRLKKMGGRTPYFNPTFKGKLLNKEKAPTILSVKQTGGTVVVTYREHGAKVVMADLMYTDKGGDRDEEWRRLSARLDGDGQAIVELPQKTSHYFINLIDENNFLVCYPEIDAVKKRQENLPFSAMATFAGYPEPKPGKAIDFGKRYAALSHGSEGATVLLSDDFEDDSKTFVKTSDPEVGITDQVAATGARSLRLFDAKALSHAWLPMVNREIHIPQSISSGTCRVAFDLMLDESAPGKLSLMLRGVNKGGKQPDFGSILFGDDVIMADGWAFMKLESGHWFHIEMAFQFGPDRDRMYTLSATTVDGHTRTERYPYSHRNFDRPAWVGLAGMGAAESRMYIDNVVVRLED